MPIPYLHLGQFGQLLLHVLLQLSRLQNGLADGANWGLSVVQTFPLGCRQRGKVLMLEKEKLLK